MFNLVLTVTHDTKLARCKHSLAILDCMDCKEPCSHTGLTKAVCAHCNVSKFTDSPTKATSKPKQEKRQAKLGVAYKKGNYKDSPLIGLGLTLEDLGLDQDDPLTTSTVPSLICSFCNKPTSKITATFGVSKIKKVDKTEVWRDSDGNVQMSKGIGHMPVNVVACPECANQVQPLTRKDGSLKHQGTILPRVID